MSEQKQINVVKAEQQTLEVFKSLFYFYKSKRDTQIKLFNANKSFSKQAIIDINNKVHNRLSLHNIDFKLTNISVSLTDNIINVYGSWPEFENENWSITQKTESVTVDWEFEIFLPNREQQVPQIHSLKIRMGRGLKPNEYFQLMMTGGDETELEENRSQMVCKIDFVNTIIATDLMKDVENWYSVLPERKKENIIYKFLGRNVNRI